jgi:RNA polymerase sigma-70 factor (ECF subfamily)
MDERADAIERLYRDRFSGYCDALSTVTGDYESARDAVQEAFTRALRDRRKLRRDGALAAWVWTIAFRVAIASPARRAAGRPAPEPQLPDPERDPALAAAIRALSPRRRLIVFLRYFAGFTYAEIADACGVSEGTVAATLAQAHAALLRELAPQEAPKCTS